MEILKTIAEVRAARRPLRVQGRTLALVPTMGAVHAGHLSLVRAAREACDAVAVSIFVNPTQFAPGEDLDTYPRTFAEDCAMLRAGGVDWVFAPSPAEMYPGGTTGGTLVKVRGLSGLLDGASRPGHFDGVATVVTKLFHIVAPERAFFGQKDAAQVAVLRAMVRELDFDVELVVCPTVREADGLAMSSRNRYLSDQERRQALVLSRSLAAVESLVSDGVCDAVTLLRAAREILAAESAVRVDYLALVDPQSLEAVPAVEQTTLCAVAVYLGTTRLIDNKLLNCRKVS